LSAHRIFPETESTFESDALKSKMGAVTFSRQESRREGYGFAVASNGEAAVAAITA
jgi:hypothetical protein